MAQPWTPPMTWPTRVPDWPNPLEDAGDRVYVIDNYYIIKGRAARFGCTWDSDRGQYWAPREDAAKLAAILRSPIPSSA